MIPVIIGINAGKIQTYLPELIFEGKINGKKIESIPRFRPGKDKISVVYFTIYENSDPCATGRKNSALPENMFRFDPVAKFNNINDLKNYLIPKDCSFEGNSSPITTSTNLILPYLQKKMENIPLFAQTYIIVASNNEYNGNLVSPSQELSNLAGAPLNVADTEAASKIASKFYSLYKTDTKIEGTQGLYFNISKVEPAYIVNSVINYSPSIDFDRKAVSSDKLQLAPGSRGGDNLKINLKLPDQDYSYEPKYLEIKFTDIAGDPLKIGDKILDTYRYDLNECQQPKCSKTEDSMTISLLSLIGDDLNFTPDELKLSEGKLHFTIGLNYKTVLYNYIYSESKRTIPLKLNPQTAGSIFPIFPAYEIENEQIISYWDSDDKEGLTAAETANRIADANNRKLYIFAFILALAVLTGMIILYKEFYPRPFKPSLKWFPSAVYVTIDFDNISPSRILLGELKIINHGQVPWLGKKLGEASQPSASSDFSLSHSSLSDLNLEVTNGNPIGFIQSNAEIENSSSEDQKTKLSLNVSQSVTHESLIFVFLSTEGFKDYVTANGSEVSPTTVTLPLTFQMNWQTPVNLKNGNTGQYLLARLRNWWKNVDSGTEQEKGESAIKLNPQNSRKAIVKFEPSESFPDDLYFDGNQSQVRIGEFVFQSQATCKFSKSFSSICT